MINSIAIPIILLPLSFTINDIWEASIKIFKKDSNIVLKMATALELELEEGDEVVIGKNVMRDTPIDPLWPGDCPWQLRANGFSYWNFGRAIILEVKEDGETIVEYSGPEEGEIRTMHNGFRGFSRERGFLKRAWDLATYTYHSIKPI